MKSCDHVLRLLIEKKQEVIAEMRPLVRRSARITEAIQIVEREGLSVEASALLGEIGIGITDEGGA